MISLLITVWQILLGMSMVLMWIFNINFFVIFPYCHFAHPPKKNFAHFCYFCLILRLFLRLPHNTYYVVDNPSFVNDFLPEEIVSLRIRRSPTRSWWKSADSGGGKE